MNAPISRPDEQSALWNGAAGRAWVESQALMDHVLRPFEELLVEAVAASAPARVLDVGCGTGATTVALARRLGARSRCTGVDISEPMLAAARSRRHEGGVPPAFLLADAETYPFEPASFDAVVSRFGVMFFTDSVHAFANLRRAARPGARLSFVAWRSAEENPFFTAAERVAAPLLPNLPVRRPDEPGQFAFSDRDRVVGILESSGWKDVRVQAIDVPCTMPEAELMPYMTRMGPVGRVLHEATEPVRMECVARLRAALAPYVHGPEVRVVSACWMVEAQA